MKSTDNSSISLPDIPVIQLPETITVSLLAEKIGQPVSVVITALMKNGVMATLNESLDYDTAAIIAAEFGIEAQVEVDDTDITPVRRKRLSRSSEKQSTRPPVVAVMGHVDHGKTSLLDTIRGSDVVAQEAGGITQHISAYHIEYKGRPITLLDTPGHEAFAALREHGAALTDVAIIVVAADDGVKPQTKEAIRFARSSGVRIIIAITKVDKPGSDLNKVKQQLVDEGLNPEEWGGDTVVVPVSSKTKEGIDQLLDMVLLVVDIDELTAETDVPAEGIVIESHMALGEGPVATLLVEHGTLNAGSILVAGETYAKIRQLRDENRKVISSAGPSRAVTISGFKTAPAFGDHFQVVADERQARRLVQSQSSPAGTKSNMHVVHTAEELLQKINQSSQQKFLNVIVKADVVGSLESITKSLESIGNEEVHVRVVASGIGNISESDISRAQASQASILAFHVSVSTAVKRAAHRNGVTIHLYQVIYELLDDVKASLEDLLTPEIIETPVGQLTVKGIFRQTTSRTICGGEVTDGKVMPGIIVVLDKDDVKIEARVEKVQRDQQEAKEILKGELCGLELATTHKLPLSIGDTLHFITRDSQRKKL